MNRPHAVGEINRATARLGLVLTILAKLDQNQKPMPGDADIRHGCHRAITAMLLDLARIEPLEENFPPNKDEIPALGMINSQAAISYLDSDQLLRMEQFIHRILRTPPPET